MQNTTATELTTPIKSAHPEQDLTNFIESILAPMGFELVAIEIHNHREKKLRVFIDLLHKTDVKKSVDESSGNAGITIEDCVSVTHALDQPLEGNALVDAVLSGPYELEVSSPGVERPLRKPSDYDRFAGELARAHTYRPLLADETRAPEYSAKNPKQKNFYGVLRGYNAQANAIQFGIIPDDGTQGKKQKGKKAAKNGTRSSSGEYPHETLIFIPLDLVSKAHLEPVWDQE